MHSLAAAAGGSLLAATVGAAAAVVATLAIGGVARLAALALALAVCCAVAARTTVALVTLARHRPSVLASLQGSISADLLPFVYTCRREVCGTNCSIRARAKIIYGEDE